MSLYEGLCIVLHSGISPQIKVSFEKWKRNRINALQKTRPIFVYGLENASYFCLRNMLNRFKDDIAFKNRTRTLFSSAHVKNRRGIKVGSFLKLRCPFGCDLCCSVSTFYSAIIIDAHICIYTIYELDVYRLNS